MKMHSRIRGKLLVTGLFVGLLSAWPGAAVQAQQPTQRERELEDQVRKLSEKVDRLESRLDGKAGQPPPVDSEEWAKIKKWVSDNSTMRPYWKDGLRFDSNDGQVKLKIGGRIQHDYTYWAENGSTERILGEDFDDGTEFRRARLYFSGTIDKDLEFKAQYDFADGDADFKDVYLGMKKVPYVRNVRVGQFKEPFSLEELTSSNYITFMERSLVTTFAPSRNTGVMFYDTMADKRMTWAAGIFRQTDDFGDGTGGRDYNATARITALPLYEDKGKRLLHVGLAYTHQNYEDDRFRIRARPEVHISPRLVDTGNFSAEYGDLIGFEAAWVHGPFSLQGEYVHAFYNGHNRFTGDPSFWAASVQASYFLTGEHRPYKTSSGAFDRVRPLKNFTKDGGPGAWELAARVSYLTLNDGWIKGGRLRDLTLGVNWYLNPNFRMMWNYVLADPSRDGDFKWRNKGGDSSAFMWRFQVAF